MQFFQEFFYVEVPGASSLLNISDFEGMVFDEPNKVKEHLFSTLKNNIENLVETAISEAIEKWGETASPIVEAKKRRGRPRKNQQSSESEQLIDLGDGVVGRLKN